MRDYLDTLFAYAFSIWAIFYSSVMAYSHDLVTFGGLIVLGCRLYVDGGRAIQKWRGK
ncbi:putative membrane protein [Rhizobium phage Palo]|uniref:Putative membrane protein n=1 Tax=Rhizobium phage Palo TaxID=2767573 RepID=A0A7L8G6K2_9CAUD|nr:putative membrane protein [Rhizobium phage Palo]